MSLGTVLALIGFVVFSHIKMAQHNQDSNGRLNNAPKASGLLPDHTAPLLSPSQARVSTCCARTKPFLYVCHGLCH